MKVRKGFNNISISSLKMELKGKFVQPHTMKVCIGGVEVQLLSFLTKVLDGYELPENWCNMFWSNGSLTMQYIVAHSTEFSLLQELQICQK
jgi:hypothetical protein